MSDFSYFHGLPRSVVHESIYGTTAVPPRQYRFGGRRYTGAASAGSEGLLLPGLLLLGLWAYSKKR